MKWKITLGGLLVASCLGAQQKVDWVNPLIGTAKMGHTFPGATVPFGMVQLSPDTDTIPYSFNGKYNPGVYAYCAGYQYNDPTIVGFSHTHFSGTGHSDLGDILLMPTQGKVQLNPGTASHPEQGFRSAYSHADELAKPNYYKVLLADEGVQAELTTTNRVGIHRYTYPKQDSANVIVDLIHGIYNYPGKNVRTYLRVLDSVTLIGFRETNGWARNRTQFFCIRFSRPIQDYGYNDFNPKKLYRGFWRKFDLNHHFSEMSDAELRAYFTFRLDASKELIVKVALSPVSMEGALRNLETEAGHTDFDRYVKAGQELWEQELSKFEVNMLSDADKTTFYTAVYHTCLEPTLYQDVDGQYRGVDLEIHAADDFTNYTTFSLWDTYRALHPLFNLVQADRNRDMIQSMLRHQEQSGQHMLPVWSHHANENWCMIGYHAVSVIADAYAKGIRGIDYDRALRACVQTADTRYFDGLGSYMDYQYVPEDKSGSSVSKTLEYAYDDWCIAQLAQGLNQPGIYDRFIQRSQYFRNVFDAKSGFMRARLSDGSFVKNFDPLDTHQAGYIEGNAWNYSLYVPQDVPALIALNKGSKKFLKHLDSLFTMELPDAYFEHTEDITRDGIIGNYVHGNEPSHHVIYLFNYLKAYNKTQYYVRDVLTKMYRPGIDGLGGNDDCGQMSAWYLFSALGFYPMCPGSVWYELGSPLVKDAVVHLSGGAVLKIQADNQGAKNVYVKSVYWNGRKLAVPRISHQQLLEGGTLRFVMSDKPASTF